MPLLRGPFRIPLGTPGVIALAVLPTIIMGVVVALEIQDPEYGMPAVLGALVAIALGPLAYAAARRWVRPPAV